MNKIHKKELYSNDISIQSTISQRISARSSTIILLILRLENVARSTYSSRAAKNFTYPYWIHTPTHTAVHALRFHYIFCPCWKWKQWNYELCLDEPETQNWIFF